MTDVDREHANERLEARRRRASQITGKGHPEKTVRMGEVSALPAGSVVMHKVFATAFYLPIRLYS